MHPLFRTIAATLALSGLVACAENSAVHAKADASSTAWSDTGGEAAPSDATWEADDDPSLDAAEGGAEVGYDGLRPVHPDVVSDSDDELYRAGEVVYIAFDLENTGDADYLHHPGLVLTSDHPDVEIPEADQWVEALDAGERSTMEWWAVVGPMVCTGDEVRFTATVTARGCEDTDEGCPVAHSASIAVVID